MIIRDRKYTQDEIGQLQAPLELDLIAYYKVMEEDVMMKIEEEIKKGLTVSELDNVLLSIIGE